MPPIPRPPRPGLPLVVPNTLRLFPAIPTKVCAPVPHVAARPADSRCAQPPELPPSAKSPPLVAEPRVRNQVFRLRPMLLFQRATGANRGSCIVDLENG